MKKYIFISLGFVSMGVISLFILGVFAIKLHLSTEHQQEKKNEEEIGKQAEKKIITLTMRGNTIYAEVVESPEDRNKGLSGRQEFREGEGMLFVFPKPDTYAFWMPDMHFSIDIVWFDENMKVVHVQKNATSESYPELFKPSSPALYVLEVPFGYIEKNGIILGDQALLRD